MVAFPFTLFFCLRSLCGGSSDFRECYIGGLWVIGSYFFIEDQIKPKRRP